jgi:hypothetical protein
MWLCNIICVGVTAYTVIKYIKYKSRYGVLKLISRGIYELRYTYNDIEYAIILPVKRGPKRISCIKDAYDNDITSIMKPYLGPNEDFHSTSLFRSLYNLDNYAFYTIHEDKIESSDI